MEIETRESEDRSVREKRILRYRKDLTELIKKEKKEDER